MSAYACCWCCPSSGEVLATCCACRRATPAGQSCLPCSLLPPAPAQPACHIDNFSMHVVPYHHAPLTQLDNPICLKAWHAVHTVRPAEKVLAWRRVQGTEALLTWGLGAWRAAAVARHAAVQGGDAVGDGGKVQVALQLLRLQQGQRRRRGGRVQLRGRGRDSDRRRAHVRQHCWVLRAEQDTLVLSASC